MGALLHHLCVLKSIDECKLFLLHALHIKLVLVLLHVLPGELLLEGLPSAALAFHQVYLSLFRSLLLLRLNHILHVTGTILFILPLLHVTLPCLLLLGLGLIRHRLLLHGCVHFAVIDCLVSLVLDLPIVLTFHFFIHLLLAEALLLSMLVHDVALALGDNLVGTLARLINLLVYL